MLNIASFTDLAASGAWDTEQASVEALDDIVHRIGLFTIHREVPGYYLQPRLEQELKRPRIDRLLTPTRRLIDMGWSHGAIGIEAKHSNKRDGRDIAQIADYARAAWKHPTNGVWIIATWTFLWPYTKPHGALASILAQHRLGTAHTSPSYLLKLNSGETTVATFHNHHVDMGTARNGHKAGSR